MALWHSVRREVAGAMRSARYDMERHREARRVIYLATAETSELARGFASAPHPARAAAQAPARPSPRPKPRRVVASAGVGLLVAGGAAGTYLAVAGSLSALRADPPTTEPMVAVAAAPSTGAPILPDEHLATLLPPPAAPRHVVPRHAAPDPWQPAPPRQVPPQLVIVTDQPTHDPEGTPTPSASPTPSPSVSDTPSPTMSAPGPGPSSRTRAGQSGSGH